MDKCQARGMSVSAMEPVISSILVYANERTNLVLYQISKEEFLNPIKQDIKKGKLRFVRNCFPHKGYLWNYGAFPRVSFCVILHM